ncbi:hypothetical protein [Pseudoxanthomonas suwonensis]|uniref:hypothetical protein n=1 Tax=Pseudoxanthomonas suwonensis TaxID=314722 RepID=UPI0012DC4521|nr:hypothetical protein [Pseudoxanthomonas suwonensis]
MDQLAPLLVTAALLLIPLAPAAVLYKVLTPKARARRGGAQAREPNQAKGQVAMDGLNFGKFHMDFNIVGSTATYVVLLVVSIATYLYLAELAEREAARVVDSKKDNQAWVVHAPIGLQDADGNVLPADRGEMRQVRIDVEPALTMASANEITFRVITTDGRFPTARFNLPGIGLKPVVLDLNDSRKVRHDHLSRTITGIQPVWIVLGQPYDAQERSAPPNYPAAVAFGTGEATP